MMVNQFKKEVNTNIKEYEARFISLKTSSYSADIRQQNKNQFDNSDNNNSAIKTNPNTPAAFMKRFQEAQMMENLKRAKRLARKSPSNKPMTDDQRYYAEVARSQKEIIKDRIDNGYSRKFVKQLSGHYVEPITEKGLRSETLNSAAALLFLAATPNGKRMRSNWGKSALETLGSKLLGLDQPYVEANKDFLGLIRIDTDRDWDSPEQCLEFFRAKAKEGKIACEPHFLVGLKPTNGRYIRPHAIWMLPYGSAVWNQKGKEGFRQAPVSKFQSVYYGLCNALLDAGADAGAPALSQQLKCPLSPEWFTICPQDSHFPDLTEHAEYLETNHNRETLTRQAARVQSGFNIKQSNALFNFLQEAAYSILTRWHFNADPEIIRFRSENRTGAIADRLHIELQRELAQSDIRPSKKDGNADYMIASVAQYAAGSFNPEKISKKSNRGAALHLVEGVNSVKERQKAGADFTAAIKAEATEKAVIEAVINAHINGHDINKTAIAKAVNISRPTVYKYWDSAIKNLNNYIQNNECKVSCMIKRYKQVRTDVNNIKQSNQNRNTQSELSNKLLESKTINMSENKWFKLANQNRVLRKTG